jgi:hypothetical protein
MRALKLVAAAFATTAVMAGCASTHASTHAASPAAAPSSSASAAAPASSPSAAPAGSSSAGAPSASATMVCGPEIQKDVATVLALSPAPTTTSTWIDHLYTCTYHLPSGTLVLSVKESSDLPSANAYFTAVQRQLGTTTPLTGAQALGNRGYQSTGGTVVILKDDKTLRVDATALPATSGASRLSRADVAYEIATDVIGCWNGN